MIEKKSEDIKECGLFISIKNVTITCFIALLKEEKMSFPSRYQCKLLHNKIEYMCCLS
jgi:hypothetical protein